MSTSDRKVASATQRRTRTMANRLWAWMAAGMLAFGSGGALAQSVDQGAAQKLAKKSGCNKCHSVSAKKEGPPYKETAAKYKGKANAEDELFKHLTSNPIIEVDGNKERHDSPKSKKEAEIRNLVRYILTR